MPINIWGLDYSKNLGTKVNIELRQETHHDEIQWEMVEASGKDNDRYSQLQTQDTTGTKILNLKEGQWLKCQQPYQ